MPFEYKDLSSIPRIPVKSQACMVAHACNPSAGEAETGGSLRQAGQPEQLRTQAAVGGSSQNSGKQACSKDGGSRESGEGY